MYNYNFINIKNFKIFFVIILLNISVIYWSVDKRFALILFLSKLSSFKDLQACYYLVELYYEIYNIQYFLHIHWYKQPKFVWVHGDLKKIKIKLKRRGHRSFRYT